jgi:hypothetical protein
MSAVSVSRFVHFRVCSGFSAVDRIVRPEVAVKPAAAVAAAVDGVGDGVRRGQQVHRTAAAPF